MGSRLERPIYFECKLYEPMHIGMRLLHSAAADHSVSISRQQVQRIFSFSLRSRAGARPLSGCTGAMATVYQSVTLDVTSEDRRIGIPTKRPRILPLPVSRGSLLCPYFLGSHKKTSYCCYGTTHSVGLDNTGKMYPFSLEKERCGISDLPEGGSEADTHMDNIQVHMEDWR